MVSKTIDKDKKMPEMAAKTPIVEEPKKEATPTEETQSMDKLKQELTLKLKAIDELKKELEAKASTIGRRGKQLTPVQLAKVKELERQREIDKEKVEGIFHYYEAKGATLSFVYRRYKGDPVEKYTLVDGKRYVLPRGVARHLVNNGSYPVHEHLLDENGKKVARVGQIVNRFGFESLDLMDLYDRGNSTIQLVDEVTDDSKFRKIY